MKVGILAFTVSFLIFFALAFAAGGRSSVGPRSCPFHDPGVRVCYLIKGKVCTLFFYTRILGHPVKFGGVVPCKGQILTVSV